MGGGKFCLFVSKWKQAHWPVWWCWC